MRVPFGDRCSCAKWHGDAVVFFQFVTYAPEGVVRTKVGDGALQRPGVAPATDVGYANKRSAQFAIPLANVGLLGDFDFTESAVPVEFFLPV